MPLLHWSSSLIQISSMVFLTRIALKFLGYDVEKTSVFYLAIRAMIHNIDVMNYISRAPRNIDDIFVISLG